MQLYPNLEALPSEPIEPVVTMGNFDGVHRGHQAILGRLKQEAERLDAPTMILTFYPHPRAFLRPDEPFEPIMSLKERCRRFWELEVDHCLVLPFDEDLMEMTATEFVQEILWDALRIQGIYVGPDTRFGHGREGDIRSLESLGRQLGYGVGVVDPVMVDGQRVSSSRIREAIIRGDLGLATRLLGRQHRIVGKVVEGDRRGRELGFPTANVEGDGGLLPPAGVYAAWTVVEEGPRLPCVVNIGGRPTFDGAGGRVFVESHIFDFDGDLYGKDIQLMMVQRLRAEIRFDGAAQLKRQIKTDVIQAKRTLGLL